MTPARWVAIGRCNAAQRICPTCRCDAGYRIPRSLGECWPCAALREHHPTTRRRRARDGDDGGS